LTAGFALGDFGIDYAQGYCIARPEALATARAQVRTLRSA
jgi:EAL domain-containing protein (putative c-di-GMP-specific phosphodiesterase class I)